MNRERRLHYRHLADNRAIPIPPELGVFACLVLIERPVTAAFRDQTCHALVERGCLYGMAWGMDCVLWDDAFDIANLEQVGWGDIPDDRFVMSTWHDGDTLGEAMRYAKVDAALSYADVWLTDLLVLDLSAAAREARITEIFERAD